MSQADTHLGPFKAVGFKMPSPDTETLYLKSVNNTVDQYGIYLRDLKADKLSLANTDFDTCLLYTSDAADE